MIIKITENLKLILVNSYQFLENLGEDDLTEYQKIYMKNYFPVLDDESRCLYRDIFKNTETRVYLYLDTDNEEIKSIFEKEVSTFRNAFLNDHEKNVPDKCKFDVYYPGIQKREYLQATYIALFEEWDIDFNFYYIFSQIMKLASKHFPEEYSKTKWDLERYSFGLNNRFHSIEKYLKHLEKMEDDSDY